MTEIIIILLFAHIILFRRMIFKWNFFGVFFISTFIFSTSGVLAFPLFKDYFIETFSTFRLELITDSDIRNAQIISVGALLLVLYSYVFTIVVFFRKVKCINHFSFTGAVQDNLSRINYFLLLLLVVLFVIIYLVIKRDVLLVGLTQGIFGRNPEAILESRRGITSNYFYAVITYNVLPFLTTVSLYLMIIKRNLLTKALFTILFSTSFFLILTLFQKRPLILFLLVLLLAGYVFKGRRYIGDKLAAMKQASKGKRKYAIYLSLLFVLLLVLYYSSTTYKFSSLFEAVSTLSEVALTRIVGRLSIPAFLYVHYFPLVDDFYGFTNIGMFSSIFGFEHFPDTQVLFEYYSKDKIEGSLAINSIIDFYGAFGIPGLIIGNIIMGSFIGILDTFLYKLSRNNINLIFIIFSFVFAYYLSQASLARAIMGYGFFFFALTWCLLQKNFKIRLRKL